MQTQFCVKCAIRKNYVVLDKNVCSSKIPILKYNSNTLGFRLKYVYNCETVAQSCCMPISQDALNLNLCAPQRHKAVYANSLLV